MISFTPFLINPALKTIEKIETFSNENDASIKDQFERVLGHWCTECIKNIGVRNHFILKKYYAPKDEGVFFINGKEIEGKAIILANNKRSVINPSVSLERLQQLIKFTQD